MALCQNQRVKKENTDKMIEATNMAASGRKARLRKWDKCTLSPKPTIAAARRKGPMIFEMQEMMLCGI